MNRRELLRALGAMTLPGALGACGGGGAGSATPSPPPGPAIAALTSDKAAYLVGEQPVITATFSGSAARLDPGNLAVTSGTPLKLPPIAATTTLRLTVGSATRDLALPVSYRNSFRSVAMGFARSAHVAVLGGDGRVLVLGGESGGGGLPPTGVMAFDPASETFSAIGTLTTGRFAHTATVLADGSVLVVGGSRAIAATQPAERFDPRTGQSRATTGQPLTNRSQHSATLLADGRVLIAGGLTPGGNTASGTVDIYDPATQQFTRLNLHLQNSRYAHVAVPITPNLVMLYGGVTVGGLAPRPEIIDIAAQTSQLLNPPFDTTPRLYAGLVRRSTGDYVALGGEDFIDSRPLANTATIAVGGIAVQPGAALAVARTRLACAALADGRVLVTGGNDSLANHALASTELFSVSAAATAPGPSLAIARMEHSATLMGNGKVLVVGGLDAARGVISTAEIYS